MRAFLRFSGLWLTLAVVLSAAESAGETTVAKWQGGAKACFMLMFDDGWPSHFQVAGPELAKRNMTATFYICPDKGEYKTQKGHWEGEKALYKQGFLYGNYTMGHKSVNSYEEADRAITGCTDYIKKIVPGPEKRLVSWAMPGVDKWAVSGEKTQEILQKNYLISRPDFKGHGIVYHLKTPKSIIDLADKAISEGGMEYAIAHGVERPKEINWGYQDFWPWKLAECRQVLDALAERRDRNDLWIADHISYHQYLTEREAAKVETVKRSAREIRIKLSAPGLDPELYNYPLTLVTPVPGNGRTWKWCRATSA